MSVGNENWKCSACGTENSSNFCRECGSVKPGYVPGNKQAQNVSDDTDGKWRCKVCGTTNTDSKCSFCGQTKSENDKFVVPQQQVVPQINMFPYPNMEPARGLMCNTPDITPPAPDDAEPWLCTNCNHTSKGGEYCFNCGMPKSKAAKKDETWICPDCNTELGKDEPFCPECGKINPNMSKREAAAKAGYDSAEPWKCRNCGFENTSGLYCEKCDASKPSKDSVDNGFNTLNPQNSPKVPMQPAFGLASLPDFIELEQMRRYNNKALKDYPKICGCYTCSKVFDSRDITAWNGDFAVCPYCQSETVISKPEHVMNFDELLDKMNRFHIKHESVDGWRCSGSKN